MIQVYNKYTFTTYNKIQGNKKKCSDVNKKSTGDLEKHLKCWTFLL